MKIPVGEPPLLVPALLFALLFHGVGLCLFRVDLQGGAVPETSRAVVSQPPSQPLSALQTFVPDLAQADPDVFALPVCRDLAADGQANSVRLWEDVPPPDVDWEESSREHRWLAPTDPARVLPAFLEPAAPVFTPHARLMEAPAGYPQPLSPKPQPRVLRPWPGACLVWLYVDASGLVRQALLEGEGGDPETAAHLRNWCLRLRFPPRRGEAYALDRVCVAVEAGPLQAAQGGEEGAPS